MGLSPISRAISVSALVDGMNYIAIHTDDPGSALTPASAEVSTSRVAISWVLDGSGAAAQSGAVSLPVPVGVTGNHVSLWTHETGGSYLGSLAYLNRTSDGNILVDGLGFLQVAGETVEFAVTSAEITATAGGRELKLTFNDNVQAGAGSAIVRGSTLFAKDGLRAVPTIGAPTISANTATFTLQDGKPIAANENGLIVDIPVGLIERASDSSPIGLSTGRSVTNNSVRTYAPGCHLISTEEMEYAATYMAEAEAFGHFALEKVVITADDGVNTPLTSGDIVARDRLGSEWPSYRHTFDLSTLDDGPVTITATAYCAATGGTRTDSHTIYNISGATLSRPFTYYVDGTSGLDSNDGSIGSPFATIGKARRQGLTDAPAAGINIIIRADGIYSLKSGGDGNLYHPPNKCLITRDPATTTLAGTIIIENGDGEIRSYGSGDILKNVSVQLNQIGQEYMVSSYVEQYIDCDLYGAGSTKGALGHPGSASVWISSGLLGVAKFYGCHVHDIVIAYGGAGKVINCTSSDHEADFASLCSVVVNSHCTNRGIGEAAFTVQYTNTGPATIFRDQSSDNIVLTDPVNGTTNIDTSVYTTVADVVAQINALTNWTATTISNTNPVHGSALSGPEKDATSEITVYNRTGYHSDLLQWWGDDFVNTVVNGVSAVSYDSDVYWGTPPQAQAIWLDHDAVTHDGLFIANVSDAQFVTGQNRSGMQQSLKDVMIAFCSTPWTALNPINNPSVGIVPDNVYVGASVVRSMAFENYDSAPIIDKETLYYGDLHFNEVAASKPITATDIVNTGGSLTVGDVTAEFSDEAVGSAALTPAASSNIEDVASNVGDFPDCFGNRRTSANSAIGAQRGPTETATYPSEVTPPSYLIEDTFARDPYDALVGSTCSDGSHTWGSGSSTLNTVDPGTCEHLTGNEYSIAFIQELVGQNDYAIEIDVSSHTNRRDAVIAFARSTGNLTEDNCYKAGIVYFTTGDTVRLAIYKSVAGVETELGSTILSADPTAPYTLTFTVNGSSLDLSWSGGSETVSVTDSEFTSGGYAGLANYAQGANVTELDQFRVTT